ncbi:MAG: diacylglycerol/lipid kinase family protein [Chloroflexota bacterium]
MTAKIILNPYSCRWKARERWPEAAAALDAAGVAFEMSESSGRGHATELAARAVREGFAPVVAAGGDGTVGEVVNGLAQAAGSGSEPLGPLGVIPLGTANDMIHNIKNPLDLAGAANAIAGGKTRSMDVIRVNDLHFVNNAALGLEPMVTIIQQDMVWVKGLFRYLLAALTAIMRNRRWNAKLTWDEGEFSGPVTLVTVGNGAVTGGLFYMTPHADPFDGKLTFVYGFRKSRLGLLAMLPSAMKPGAGSYVEKDGIHEVHATRLNVRLEQPSPAHADGELFSQGLHEAEFSIQPGRLKILIP